MCKLSVIVLMVREGNKMELTIVFYLGSACLLLVRVKSSSQLFATSELPFCIEQSTGYDNTHRKNNIIVKQQALGVAYKNFLKMIGGVNGDK